MKPKYFTKKQSELLQLVYPGPIGEALTVREASKRLGIAESSAFERLKRVKDRFPDAYQQYQAAKRIASENREQLRKIGKYSLDAIIEKIGFSEDLNIKEKF